MWELGSKCVARQEVGIYYVHQHQPYGNYNVPEKEERWEYKFGDDSTEYNPI